MDDALNAHGAAWRGAEAPDIEAGRDTGRLRGCGYCGSMHPADVAAAIRAGARVEIADRKYGWPHKVYLREVPNPHAGLLEVRSSTSFPAAGYVEASDPRAPRFDSMTGKPLPPAKRWIRTSTADATTWGKFYTEHLQDATPEDRATIEGRLGLRFEFKDGKVEWGPA